MTFQLICVLLGSCLLASVYGADVEETSESQDFKCFSCLLKCAGKILHLKEFGKCLLDCVNPSVVQHRTLDVKDHSKLPIRDGEGKAAAVANGGECVSCALNCVTSGTCTGIRSCMACVGKCLMPGKSAKLPESESVEQQEESASEDEPTEESQVTHLRDTGALTHPPPVQDDSSEEQTKKPIHDLGVLTHPPPVQDDSSEETKKPTRIVGLLTLPPVQDDSSEEKTKRPTPGDLGVLTRPPSHKPWDTPKTTTTTRKPPAPASSEEQVEQEQSDESAEVKPPPTNVTPIVIVKPSTKAAELSEEPQQDQSDD